MFIGHFGIGFGAKVLVPKVSLGTLFLAAQFLDLLWPTLLLAGLEHVRVDPGATVVTPLRFDDYPVSHSLLAVLGWALLIGRIYWIRHRDLTASLVVGALVLSHWGLDAVVHQTDLPLFPGSATVVGWNAWHSLPLTLSIEVPLFGLGVGCYVKATKPADGVGRWGFWALVVFLLAIYGGNLFGSPPPSAIAIAWVGQLQWLIVLWGYWIDRHRLPAEPVRTANIRSRG